MKRKRFTEEQIISILKEREAGMKVAELGRRQRGIGAIDLPLAEQVRRPGGLRGESAAAAGGGESTVMAGSTGTMEGVARDLCEKAIPRRRPARTRKRGNDTRARD